MSSNIMVYIVDDDEAMRDSLALLFNAKRLPFRKFNSAEEFLQSLDSSLQGCLLLDVQMPGMTGLELQELLKDNKIPVPVIIMTGHGDIAMAVDAMKSGAYDFIEKPFNADILLGKVKSCLEESQVLSAMRRKLDIIQLSLEQLTPREREVAELLAHGQTNKDIASKLAISVRTVELHRARVMEKLHAKSVVEISHYFNSDIAT